MSQYTLCLGDSLEVLKDLPDNSIDSIVTDPPYELGFMGKKWDASGIAYNVELWRQCLRVLKPGGHLLSFGGTRTYHRMACAIEDAGFEIRDSIHWLYGTGFPKSLNISKEMDKRAGAEREVVGYDASRARPNRKYEAGAIGNIGGTGKVSDRTDNGATLTAPATDAAKQWDGWGTALKPAHEPVVMARKPLAGTVAENVLEHGTGGLNIDASRIEGAVQKAAGALGGYGASKTGAYEKGTGREYSTAGRWPANVILDEFTAELLDEQTGQLTTGTGAVKRKSATGSQGNALGKESRPEGTPMLSYGDTGGASRFFYVAKPSRTERDLGCEHLPPKSAGEVTDREEGSDGLNSPRAGAGRTAGKTFYVGVKEQWVREALVQAGLTDGQSRPRKGTGEFTMQPLDGAAWSTCWCGSPSTDPYHPVIKSIIETKTSSITDPTTFSWLTRPHTNGCMAAAFGEMASGGSLASCAANPSPWMLSTGTSAEKDGRSTDGADLATSVESWLTGEPVAVGRQGVKSSHPTVKPVTLMRYLVKMVTPPGGVVLDPFLGSGTTGMAAVMEGFNFIGVELTEEYLPIAEARIKAAAQQ